MLDARAHARATTDVRGSGYTSRSDTNARTSLLTRRALLLSPRRVFVSGLVFNTVRVPLAAALARRDGPLGGATGVWIALSVTTALKAVVKYALFHTAPLRPPPPLPPARAERTS